MSNSKLTLVLMAGLAGSGKTTLARRLSHELKWCYVYRDIYREVIKKHLKEMIKEREILEKEAGRIAYELAFDVVRKALNGEKREKYREVLRGQGLDECMASSIVDELRTYDALRVPTGKKTSVILDSSARPKKIVVEAQQIVRSTANAQLKIILCIADYNLRHERMRTRPEQDVSISHDLISIDQYLQRFDHLPSGRLELDTSLSFEKCLAVAIDYLQS